MNPTSRLRLLLFLTVPLMCGAVALLSGQDASWDLRNYHYYNGWALLHGHVHRDLLVAQIPSFYNPLLDLPYAWAAPILGARLLAFLLGSLHGINFILLTLLGEALLTEFAPALRMKLSALLAAAGTAGAVAFSEIGAVFYDNVVSIGLFATLLLLARRWDRLIEGRIIDAVLAGVPLGLAFGVKQTMALYIAGLVPALVIALPARLGPRLRAGFCFGVGIGIGFLASGGFWMARLWLEYGNPMFPYFNQIFHSPWGLDSDYRDPAFQPKTLVERLFFPLTIAMDSRASSEVDFRDLRLPLLFLLLPLSPRFGAHRRPRTLLLVVAVAIAYVLWLRMFAIYRYLVAVEMLAPLLAALVLSGLAPRRRVVAILAVTLALVATTRPAQWIRVPFSARAIETTLPAIQDPEHSLVVLAGHEPLSFLIPAFPEPMRFLRIDSTFTNPDQTQVRFNPLMKAEIDAHHGPLLALYIATERHDVVKRLGNDGLVLTDRCGPVRSNIGAGDYELCAVEKR
jgi:hypothetical protein